MTWQLGSVLVLMLALGVGFAWYEQSRPPARVLALVAALAALAAIGRVVFAAFPNVKPTSDIVLFSGYALGGPAGFAVGALAALVSNVFLGQGPWTPWQMVAWGTVGLIGAVFGRVMRGREPNRWLLAAVCGLSGLLFGAIMDLYQWTLAAEHTFASYVAISGTSLAFNVAHAVGNVAFAVILGPAFIRALARYRRRFEVRWVSAQAAGGLAAAAIAVALVAAPAPAQAAPPADVAPAVSHAVRYVRFSQNSDGGFGAARRQGSVPAYTGWSALALASAARNPLDVSKNGHSIIDYVNAHASALSDIGELERTMLVLHAAGRPQSVGGRNLLVTLVKKQRPDGSFTTVNHTAFGVLALRAAGKSTRSSQVRRAVSWLLRAQNADGGYGFNRAAASDTDDTGAVVQALVAGGRKTSPVVRRAVAYLIRAQRPDGGFGQMAGSQSNAQSTSWAIQGLVAAGRNPRKLRKARTPIEYLKSLQDADGSVRYSRTSTQTPVWVTAQALVALEGKPYPLRPAPRKEARTAAPAAASAPSTRAPTTPAPTAKPATAGAKSARAERSAKTRSKRRHAAAPASTAAPDSEGYSRLETSTELRTKPVAATTTTSTTTSNASAPEDDVGLWPYLFAALLGVLMLVGIRLAWRRG